MDRSIGNYRRRRRGECVLKQRLHQQHGVPRFSIIPPVWNKAIESPVYAHLWRRARWAIRQAHTIVVIGFSFAPTDLYAQSLFRVAFFRQDRTRLRRLVIVSPDKSARQRVRQIFDVPLTDHRVVLRQYERLEEFADALPAALT